MTRHYNVLSLLQRAVEHAHRLQTPDLEVSTYHLSVQVKSGYEGMLIAVPAEHWPSAASQDPQTLAQTLLRLAQRILPKQVATSKREPKTIQPKGYVDPRVASAHASTARLIKQAREVLTPTPFKVFGKSAASCRFWASTDQKWQMIAQKISRFMANLLAVGH